MLSTSHQLFLLEGLEFTGVPPRLMGEKAGWEEAKEASSPGWGRTGLSQMQVTLLCPQPSKG